MSDIQLILLVVLNDIVILLFSYFLWRHLFSELHIIYKKLELTADWQTQMIKKMRGK